MDYKEKLLGDIFLKYKNKNIKILDIGSGTSQNFIKILKENSGFHYTGIEYSEKSIKIAKKNLEDLNFRILRGFGENQETLEFESFDFIISLSVLEHVKHLDNFLENTSAYLKKGGKLIHRYDLGHAIYPSTKREKLKVYLSNNFSFLISKKHFTCYPSLDNIKKKLFTLGIDDIKVTQHQMPSLKKSINILSKLGNSDMLISEILNIEERVFERLEPLLDQKIKDELFPTILLIGTKK